MLRRKSKLWMQRGFSLIEIILVMVIIGLVVVPMSRLSKANVAGLGQYTLMTMAEYELQDVMEDIMMNYTNKGPGTSGYNWVKTNWAGKSGTTDSGKFNYSVAMAAEQVINGVTVTKITVTLTAPRMSSMKMYTWISK